MYSEKQKEYIYKWNKNNPERKKQIQSKAQEKYVRTHRQKVSEISLNYYYRHKEEILQKLKEKRDKQKLNKEGK